MLKTICQENQYCLHRTEWEFKDFEEPGLPNYKGCPDDQIFDCFEFEYTRQAILENRTDSPPHTLDPRSSTFYDLFRAWLPNTPWLMIDPGERTGRLEILNGLTPQTPAIKSVPARALLSTDGELLNRREFYQFEGSLVHTSVVPFQIGWNFPDAVIIAEFKSWLKANVLPKNELCKEGRAGTGDVGTIRSALTALGAWRLLKKVGSVKDAMQFTSDERCGGTKGWSPLFEDPGHWSDRKKTAEYILDGWPNPLDKLRSDKRVAQYFDNSVTPLEPLFAQVLTPTGCRRLLALTPEKRCAMVEWMYDYAALRLRESNFA